MKARRPIGGATLVAIVTLTAIPTPVAAQPAPNLALSFDGTNDLVVVPNRPAIELTDGTLELWFRPDWTPGSINYDPVRIGDRVDLWRDAGAWACKTLLQAQQCFAGISSRVITNAARGRMREFGETADQLRVARVDSRSGRR
jgi:hypothetical protein